MFIYVFQWFTAKNFNKALEDLEYNTYVPLGLLLALLVFCVFMY